MDSVKSAVAAQNAVVTPLVTCHNPPVVRYTSTSVWIPVARVLAIGAKQVKLDLIHGNVNDFTIQGGFQDPGEVFKVSASYTKHLNISNEIHRIWNNLKYSARKNFHYTIRLKAQFDTYTIKCFGAAHGGSGYWNRKVVVSRGFSQDHWEELDMDNPSVRTTPAWANCASGKYSKEYYYAEYPAGSGPVSWGRDDAGNKEFTLSLKFPSFSASVKLGITSYIKTHVTYSFPNNKAFYKCWEHPRYTEGDEWAVKVKA